MRALIAFDKFKDALSALEACRAAADALGRTRKEWQVDLCPLADGGEGFAGILTQAAKGTLRTHEVSGPRGRPTKAAYGIVPWANIPVAARTALRLASISSEGTVAVIEMAAASGLALLANSERDAWATTSAGTGELMRIARDERVAAILLGVGGSATNDLGLGALSALGMKFVDAENRVVAPPVPKDWARIRRIESQVDASLPPVRIACDVSNPLLGHNGAAAVYGPQKGLKPDGVLAMDKAAARMAEMLAVHCGQPDTLRDQAGAGAAGGIAFGLMAAAHAELLPGFDVVASWLDLDARIAAADLVITGEGRFDDSSLSGKGPGAVAARALSAGKPTHVFAGKVTATVQKIPPGLSVHAVTPAGQALEEALRAARANLSREVEQVFA